MTNTSGSVWTALIMPGAILLAAVRILKPDYYQQ